MIGSFTDMVTANIKEGMVFDNPGRGTSLVLRVTPESITYVRGQSKIIVKLEDLNDAYRQFAGSICSTLDLKKFRMSVFSSAHNGHGCNCTFFFLLLYYLKLSSEIMGGGVKGNPFYVIINKID